uniref:Uncharacterized protein n=1 Tax=Quercus lobata TaxID=97700 RepID=A0A7N2KVV8_QUELO
MPVLCLRRKSLTKKKKKKEEERGFPSESEPKENPSERATIVSEHGEYSPLLSLAASTETRKLEQRALMGAAGSKLEKALGDQFPEGERYFGLENFSNTRHCNSVLQGFNF